METDERGASGGPRRHLAQQVATIVVPLAIVLLATTAVAWVAIFGQPGVPRPPSNEAVAAATATPAADATGAPQPTITSPPPVGSCGQHSLTAPAEGRWVLHRAEFGSRGGHDYLRLMLRRDGTAGESARMLAELVPASELEERHSAQAPSRADTALVARFDGPVRIPGQFGGRGSGALGAFTITERGGSVYVVAGINGDHCFQVVGGAWADGGDTNAAEITIMIGQ